MDDHFNIMILLRHYKMNIIKGLVFFLVANVLWAPLLVLVLLGGGLIPFLYWMGCIWVVLGIGAVSFAAGEDIF